MRLSAVLLMLLSLAVALASGCSRGFETDDAHAAHVVPAHKPSDFASTPAALAERLDEALQHSKSSGHEEFAAALTRLSDVVRWLPELAAETDLPEREWNEVNAISKRLLKRLEPLTRAAQRGTQADLTGLDLEFERAISQLEALMPPPEVAQPFSEP